MTYYTVTITNNETGATNIIKFNCNILSALRTEVNLFCVLRKDITKIFDCIKSDEFDIDDETLKQAIILLKMLIADEYEASDVTFDRVKLAKGGD